MDRDYEMSPVRNETPSHIVYPALNVYFSPRVFQQKIDHRSIPMCKYKKRVEASNIKKIADQMSPDSSDLTSLSMQDGLIYQFSQMNKPQMVDGMEQPPLKIKVLACVCMYNESFGAINLTLNGIYENLDNLALQGISHEEVAVVLMQDGILKLVQDRNKRTYAKGEGSMVEFFRKLDEHDGKPKCDLEERINVILDEIDNYNRRGMGSLVANNKDFPPSI